MFRRRSFAGAIALVAVSGCGGRVALPGGQEAASGAAVNAAGGQQPVAGGVPNSAGGAPNVAGGRTSGGAAACDADGDGHARTACGGDDCDDTNTDIHPGALDRNVTDGPWRSEIVLERIPGDTRGQTSIALDRDGFVHISEASAGLRYATNPRGPWVSLIVDSRARGPSALALSADGAPRIAYRVGNGVHFATKDDFTWLLTKPSDLPPAMPPEAGGGLALAIDASERWHLAYTGEDGSVVLAQRSGEAWTVQPDIIRRKAIVLAIELNAEGVPHVVAAATDEPPELLVVRPSRGADFVTTRVVLGEALSADIAINPEGFEQVLHGQRSLRSKLIHSARQRLGPFAHESLTVASPLSVSVVAGPKGSPFPLQAVSAVGGQVTLTGLGPNGWAHEPAGRGHGPDLALEGTSILHYSKSDFRFDLETHVIYTTNRSFAPNGIDENCDGTDGVDRDGDGDASLPTGGSDCDDRRPEINGNAPDPVGDLLDSDCDDKDG